MVQDGENPPQFLLEMLEECSSLLLEAFQINNDPRYQQNATFIQFVAARLAKKLNTQSPALRGTRHVIF